MDNQIAEAISQIDAIITKAQQDANDAASRPGTTMKERMMRGMIKNGALATAKEANAAACTLAAQAKELGIEDTRIDAVVARAATILEQLNN